MSKLVKVSLNVNFCHLHSVNHKTSFYSCFMSLTQTSNDCYNKWIFFSSLEGLGLSVVVVFVVYASPAYGNVPTQFLKALM